MKVGIYYVGGSANPDENHVHAYLGSLAAQVTKQTMPGVEICHLTDMNAKAIQGVDKVIRMERDCPMAVFRMRHHQAPGEWLFIDSDVMVVKDVRGVFDDKNFDIAIAKRNKNDGADVPAFKEMPHNMGVVFSRSPEFWKVVESELLTYKPDMQEWMGDQLAVCRLIKQVKQYGRIKFLPGTYNFAPNHPEMLGDASILHFKGPRKQFMRTVADRETV